MSIRVQKSTLIFCAVLIWIVNKNDANVRHDIAEETQHAICNISTKDVQTSANASVTRQLRGVCTSKQMDLRFKELESKVIREIKMIQRMLRRIHGLNIIDTDYIEPDDPDINSYSTRAWEERQESDDIEEIKPHFSLYKTTSMNNVNEGNEEPIFILNQQPNESESLIESNSVQEPFTDANRLELLNCTSQKEDNNNIYYYFWKVENFNRLMKKTDIYVTSQSFIVLGHDLKIQLFPNQPQKNYLTIKLRASSSFVKKHKFSILKRTHNGRNINSPFLGANPKARDKFSVTLRSIRNSECLKEDNIIIELNIFL
ncbi:uncharacterized protein LOC123678123 [Harmonia axyridis]|uniref:uncharacterized protein LOC123678123 n=1 Tax=Harmonia axyridis TaxID=115357 RepID=UPI001E27673B|nr:uncharacterized protein LOC123678123 [Harmonia axyridis]